MELTQIGPVVGLRVLELETLISGPFAKFLLADPGADVKNVKPKSRPSRPLSRADYHHESAQPLRR